MIYLKASTVKHSAKIKPQVRSRFLSGFNSLTTLRKVRQQPQETRD
ncbi:MAG: hypothetical protein V7K50_20395 [Nostoc sp.]